MGACIVKVIVKFVLLTHIYDNEHLPDDAEPPILVGPHDSDEKRGCIPGVQSVIPILHS